LFIVALASGACELGQNYLDSMVRDHLRSVAVVGGETLEIVFDVSRLNGASGDW
jgi:hypothetical protein